LAVVFIDELASGVLPASAADVARDIAIPGGLAAGGIVTAFHLLAPFVEAPLLAWSERVSVRWFSAGSLAALAIATLGAALAGDPITLVVCLALYGPASGCALAAAEGALVESRPAERERTLARLGLAGALGDLAVPLLLAALALAGLGWRAAVAISAGAAAALAAVHAASTALNHRPVADVGSDDKEGPSLVEALRFALTTRPLLSWSLAVSLTALLDEVLIAFVIVRLDAATALERALAVGSWTVGVLGGLLVLERCLHLLDTRRVLLGSAGAVAACLVALTFTRDVNLTVAILFVLGASTSALHPIASAQAYASLPGRPALVNAAAAALVPFDALAPLLLAALSLWLGLGAAILALLVAPIGIALAASRWLPPRGRRSPP
jgi:MFS family permease